MANGAGVPALGVAAAVAVAMAEAVAARHAVATAEATPWKRPFMRRQRNRLRRHRPTPALQHLHTAIGPQLQPQRSRGGLRRMAGRAHGQRQTLPVVGRHLQPPQRCMIGTGQPAHDRRTAARTQALLESPERIGRTARSSGTNDHQPRQIDPCALPRPGKGHERRRHQHHPATGTRQPRQHRPQQLQLGQSPYRHQQLGQRCRRPAAHGQHRIQRADARGNARHRLWCHPPLPYLPARQQGGQCDGLLCLAPSGICPIRNGQPIHGSHATRSHQAAGLCTPVHMRTPIRNQSTHTLHSSLSACRFRVCHGLSRAGAAARSRCPRWRSLPPGPARWAGGAHCAAAAAAGRRGARAA